MQIATCHDHTVVDTGDPPLGTASGPSAYDPLISKIADTKDSFDRYVSVLWTHNRDAQAEEEPRCFSRPRIGSATGP